MKKFVFAAVLALSPPALAFDGQAASEKYYEVRGDCRMAETKDGQRLTDAEQDERCALLEKLGKELRDNGYCWDKSEVAWEVCEPQGS